MIELAEDEMKNFVKVWLSVFVSLSYCYIVGKIIPKGFTRLLAILPVISLFLVLPLNLTSVHLCGLTSFFIAWLANFKLLLFAFGKPPLCFDPPISFPLFLAVACLPIKIQQYPHPKSSLNSDNNQNPGQKSESKSYPPPETFPKPQNKQDVDQKPSNESCPPPQKPKKTHKSPWNFIIKGALLALIIRIYDYSDSIHPKILWLIYCFHIYFALEIVLACFAKAANFFLGLELEPQFNEPLLSISLQDFWGRRWNLMVTRILRPTVYLPTLDLSTKFFGRQAAALPAVMATFLVSAIMHELIFYYIGRVKPTFEVTWFFLLHGFCLCLEIAAKKLVSGKKWRVPRGFSGPATAAFVVATGFWLFLPPLLRAGLDTRGLQEYAAVGAYLRRVSSRDLGSD